MTVVDELDPRNWPLDVPTARAIWREDQAKLSARRTRRVRNLMSLQLASLVDEAVAGGAIRKGDGHFYEWDVSAGCLNPGHIRQFSTGLKGTVEMIIPCRTQCEVCLKKRRNLWSARALTEARMAARTWQATFTVRPSELYKASLIAERRADHAFGLAKISEGSFRSRKTKIYERGWADLTPGEQFGLKVDVLGEDVTRWLKRVRKRCFEEWQARDLPVLDGALRYLLVVEAHESGEPHWHALIHETSPVHSLRYDWLKLPPDECPGSQSNIDARWGLGFSSYKLIPVERATYATKYLAKSLLARVRASKRYGEHSPSRTPKGKSDPTQKEEGGARGRQPSRA